MPTKRLRLLWVPYAQRGSVYPIAPAIQALGERDVETLAVGLPSLKSLSTTLQVSFLSYECGISYDWSVARQRDQHGLGPVEAGADWFHERVATEYREVERAVRSFRPDVLLVDSFVIGAGLVAERLGIPWASYVHYLFDESAETDDMHCVWWAKAGQSALAAYCAWWDGVRAAVGLGPEPRNHAKAPWYRMSPQCTFLLGHPLLRRGARPLPGYVSRTSMPPWDESAGPPHPAAKLATSAPRRRPRILVANSSAWQDDIALVHAALKGLADRDVEIVVTIAAEHSVSIERPRNATVLGYTSHVELLPEMDAVVTTSGYGIASKALWFGKPLIAAPHARDQRYVAEAVATNGCGVDIGWPPTPGALAAAVDTALSSPTLREQARRLSGPMLGFLSSSGVASAVAALTRRQ